MRRMNTGWPISTAGRADRSLVWYLGGDAALPPLVGRLPAGKAASSELRSVPEQRRLTSPPWWQHNKGCSSEKSYTSTPMMFC